MFSYKIKLKFPINIKFSDMYIHKGNTNIYSRICRVLAKFYYQIESFKNFVFFKR